MKAISSLPHLVRMFYNIGVTKASLLEWFAEMEGHLAQGMLPGGGDPIPAGQEDQAARWLAKVREALNEVRGLPDD